MQFGAGAAGPEFSGKNDGNHTIHILPARNCDENNSIPSIQDINQTKHCPQINA
jgi:hypothetical protein